MAVVAGIDGVPVAALHIDKYLLVRSHRVRKHIMSGGWVFLGWIGFSQWFKKGFGGYPKREVLVELARISKAGPEEETWFGIYSGEKERVSGGNKLPCVPNGSAGQ